MKNEKEQIHHIFFATSFEGEIQLGGEEAIENNENDQYILEWFPLNKLDEITILRPDGVREYIKKYI